MSNSVHRAERDAGAATLLEMFDALLIDLDGVVYVGSDPVPHAVTVIRRARAAGHAVAYVTNNAGRSPSVVAHHLREFGLDVADHDVVTSAQAGAREISARLPRGSTVLAVGGPGVAEALLARGLTPVSRAEEKPSAVMMGYGADVSWRELAEASYAVAAGALFVATNTDVSFPLPQGRAPGNGAFVAAVVGATGQEPLVAGKPYLPLITESIERVGAQRPIIVGDRLDTDIEAGQRAGIATLLVFTGVTGVSDLLAAPPRRRPTYIAADLRGMLAPPRNLLADMADMADMADVLPPPAGADDLRDLRQAARAAWAAADAGLPAPAVDVESLTRDVVRALASG